MREPPRPDLRMEAVQSPVVPIVADLIRETPETISLGQGVVCYGPPATALRNVSAHGAELDQFYGPVHGIPELNGLLTRKLAHENRIAIGDERRLIVTAGALTSAAARAPADPVGRRPAASA